jgi:hypothetical protein
LFVHASPPAISDSDQLIVNFVTGQANGLRAQGVVEAIGTAFLLSFAVYLTGLIRRAEGSPEGIGTLALAGAISATTLNWVWCATSVLLGSPGVGQPVLTHALYDIYQILLAVLPFPGAVYLGGVAAGSLRFRILPNWLAWGAALVALLQLLSGIDQMLRANGQSIVGLAGFLLLLLWLIASSVTLGLRESKPV